MHAELANSGMVFHHSLKNLFFVLDHYRHILLTLLISHDRVICIRPPIAEKLPCIADLADLIHVEIGDD